MTKLNMTRRVAFFLAFNVLIINTICWLAMKDYNPGLWGIGRAIEIVFTLDAGSDSWKVQRIALGHLNHSKEPLYSELVINRGVKFHYPLTTMILYEPVQYLTAWSAIDPDRLMNAIGWIFTASFIIATASLFESCLREPHYEPDERHGTKIRLLMVGIATLTFFPFIWGFAKGNWQHWINAAFAAALLAWVAGYKATSGSLVGFMCLIKPHYAPLLIWAALRREWRFGGACLLVGFLGVLASISIYGFSNNIDYVNALSFMSERGATYYHNQSINGVLNRLMSLFDPQSFPNYASQNPYPPYTQLVFWGTFITSALILGAALVWRSSNSIIDLCIITLSCAIASPIAWTYQYALLLPIYAVALSKTKDQKFFIWIGISYVLTSNYIVAFNAFAATPLNIVQSYLLIGALILLIVLYHLAPGKTLMPFHRTRVSALDTKA